MDPSKVSTRLQGAPASRAPAPLPAFGPAGPDFKHSRMTVKSLSIVPFGPAETRLSREHKPRVARTSPRDKGRPP
jgi:hypothetical protein